MLMDLSVITNLISSIGFPIVMCIIMMWYIKYTNDKDLEERKNYYTELNDVKQAIDNNTQVITQLITRLDKEV